MVKMVFKVDGGGDSSVGINDTHATVTIEDNYKEVDKYQQELFIEFLREFYDIPKHMGSVLTLEEYEIQREAEKKYYESMSRDEKEELFRTKVEELEYTVENYSGREMFGRKCPSVTVESHTSLNDFIAKIGITGLRIDSMGLGYVVYTG